MAMVTCVHCKNDIDDISVPVCPHCNQPWAAVAATPVAQPNQLNGQVQAPPAKRGFSPLYLILVAIVFSCFAFSMTTAVFTGYIRFENSSLVIGPNNSQPAFATVETWDKAGEIPAQLGQKVGGDWRVSVKRDVFQVRCIKTVPFLIFLTQEAPYQTFKLSDLRKMNPLPPICGFALQLN